MKYFLLLMVVCELTTLGSCGDKRFTFYYNIISPPCRAVLMLIHELKIEDQFKMVTVNLIGEENRTPEFRKKNPQHTVPVLEGDGLTITDSHVIMAYLADVHKDRAVAERFYPTDKKNRALVDCMMYYEAGHLFCRLRVLYEPIFYFNKVDMPEEWKKYMESQYEYVNDYLKKTEYLCGDHLTIADLSVVTTITSISDYVKVDPVKHYSIVKWIERISVLDSFKEKNIEGAKQVQEVVEQCKAINKNKKA